MLNTKKRKLILTFEVNTALPELAMKEYIAMAIEKHGDVRCTEIVDESCNICENDYGGDVIKQVREKYKKYGKGEPR